MRFANAEELRGTQEIHTRSSEGHPRMVRPQVDMRPAPNNSMEPTRPARS
jgi:hypothetical protein